MMSLPPFNKPVMQHPKVPSHSPHEPEPEPTSPLKRDDFKSLEKDLGKVDKELLELISILKKGSPLLKTLENMEEEIKSLIADVKKQLMQKPDKVDALQAASKIEEDLTQSLRKLEDELKELKSKEGKLNLTDKEKKALDVVQGEVAAISQQLSSFQQTAENFSVKEAGGVGSLDTRAEVSKTVALIQKMVSQIHVGTVGSTTFTSMDMKNTSEVPSYFKNANVTITPDAAGKMTVQFSNMTAEQQAAAIAAIQQHPELLLDLMDRVSLNRLQIGDQIVTLPAQTEREQGRGREGGGGGQQGREGREQEERK